MFFGNQGRDWAGGQSLSQQLFNLGQAALVGIANQSPRPPRRTCTAHATDAVNVVFGMNGQIHHDNVAQTGNIHSSCSHVGRHQQLHLFPAKGIHRSGALCRGHATMGRCRGMALNRNMFDQFLNRFLGRNEHQRLPDVPFGEHQVQHLELVLMAVTENQIVHDRFRDRIRLSQTDVRGFLRNRCRQFPNTLRQGRRV